MQIELTPVLLVEEGNADKKIKLIAFKSEITPINPIIFTLLVSLLH